MALFVQLLARLPRNQRVRWIRSSIAFVLSCAVLLASIGFPARNRPSVDSHERFPCENCPCGCTTAESCWRSCCCRTDAEKLAWASEQGVIPPDYVVDFVEAESTTTAGARCTACCEKAQREQSDRIAISATDRTSRQHSPPTAMALRGEDPRSPAGRVSRTARLILIEDLRKCGGLPPLWKVLSNVTVGLGLSRVVAEPDPREWLIVVSEMWTSACVQPEVPPPRDLRLRHTPIGAIPPRAGVVSATAS